MFNTNYDFTKIDRFVKRNNELANRNWEGLISEEEKKGKPALLTRTCPPGVALVGPDMTEVRVLVNFCMLRVQNFLFEVIPKLFCKT